MPKKPTEYDKTVIKELISKFHEEENTKAMVKAIDIHRYAERKHVADEFPYATTYDFWKREDRVGKQLIDEFNAIRTNTYSLSKGTSYAIVDVTDLLEKHGENNDVLRDHLLPMEKQLRTLALSLAKAEELVNQQKQEIEKLKSQLNDEKTRSNKLQTLLYQMFSYSASGATLDNLINAGTSRTDRVEKAFRDVFSDPTEFLDGFSNHVSTKSLLPKESAKIVPLKIVETHENDESWDL